MNEKIQKLFEADEFSQEFKNKVTVVFESAVEDRVTEVAEEIEAKYSKISEEYSEYVLAELTEKKDQYISEEIVPMIEKYVQYSVDEFMKENKIAIESGVKIELAESFLSGLSGVAENFNVNIPAGQEDVLVEMEQKLNKMQERFDKVLDEKVKVEEELQIERMSTIVDAKVANLTESQKEKFYQVAARVSFKDQDQFVTAIDDLFESYFPVVDAIDKETVNETINASISEEKEIKSTRFNWLDQI